ncbi:MAG: sigma-70 family RNA polymerase sigma factor [Actinomycetia bacterium]|nr:sigma-70 family RNA polymerase sigma factor [Actinomycetes bacterium]
MGDLAALPKTALTYGEEGYGQPRAANAPGATGTDGRVGRAGQGAAAGVATEGAAAAAEAVTKIEAAFVEQMPTHDAVQRYKNMVYAIALTHSRQRVDADDVFQQVFLVYHRKQPSFECEDRRQAWLITTTLNCARQKTGSSWSRKVVYLGDGLDGQAASEGADFRFVSDDQDAVFQAMRKLPDNYRIVLYLFYFQDLPVARISEILQIEAGTVKVQLNRGRAKMREMLKGAYFDEQ